MPTIAMEKCFEEFEANYEVGFKPSNIGFESWTYGSLGKKVEKLKPVKYKSTFTDAQIKDYMCEKINMNFTSTPYKLTDYDKDGKPTYTDANRQDYELRCNCITTDG